MNHTRPLPPTVTTVTDKVQHKSPQERILASKVDASSYEIQVMRHRSKVPAERLTAPETSQQEIGWLIGVRSLELKGNKRLPLQTASSDCSRGEGPAVLMQQARDLPANTVTDLNSLNPSRWRHSKSTCDVTQYVDDLSLNMEGLAFDQFKQRDFSDLAKAGFAGNLKKTLADCSSHGGFAQPKIEDLGGALADFFGDGDDDDATTDNDLMALGNGINEAADFAKSGGEAPDDKKSNSS
ncbi:hypothetical protein FOL47_001658 [Perkinsus chesapeaki]|uniref:Uncharacterized protein n=1 Tax=Perkinsus chesapeaki TaxID=330153 RepID=A0A7J6MHX2_PERCH|nr:hypothetical protein FOL47_001658 [Perkinsus chesapeaki]